MRRKKHKHTRRAVAFYKLSYGFHEPFKILLDGNFIHATHSANMADLGDHIPKLIGGKCKLYVTRCVTHELKELGDDFWQALRAARGYELHKCGHEPGSCSAADCVRQAVGSTNRDHWWVASQDKGVRDALGNVPGVPCIFATVNGIHLEAPPEMSRTNAKQVSEAALQVPRHERQTAALAGVDLGALDASRVKTNVQFRKVKAKGPNPLSIKKKTTKKAGAPPLSKVAEQPAGGAAKQRASQQTEGGEDAGGGKKRKRRRGGTKGGAGGSGADGAS